MADPTGFSDGLPSEWREVSVSTVYPPSSRPQNLVFLYAARKSELCRVRGDASPPEHPRIIGQFTQPQISIQSHPRDSVGHAIGPGIYAGSPFFPCPRPIGSPSPNPHPSWWYDKNLRHLFCVDFGATVHSSISSYDTTPAQLAYDPTGGLQPWGETVGFHSVGVYLV